MEISLDVPLKINVSKAKNFSLNLNVYRNAHHMTLSKAKRNYTEWLKPLLMGLEPFYQPVEATYTLYPPTARRLDVSNVCSIVDKFVMDALVEYGILADDDFHIVPKVTYCFGSVDAEYPRVTVTVKSI